MQFTIPGPSSTESKNKNRPAIWSSIRAAIDGGIGPQILHRYGFGGVEIKRQFVCPSCGATKAKFSCDRYVGGCDGCKSSWGSLIDFLSFASGRDPIDIAREAVEVFVIEGHQGGAQRIPSPASPQAPKPAPARDPDGYCRRRSVVSEFSTIAPKVLSAFVGVDRGFTAQAIKELECQAVSITARSHPAIPPQSAIAFPAYGRLGLSISNYILRPVREDASIIGCGPDGKMEKRKKTVAYAPAKGAEYDRSGIVCTPAVRDALKRGEPLPGVHVVKLEGELDVASSLSILAPDEYVVFTNAHGARELLPWVIELFSKLNPASWILIGDRDAAGEAGAARWANEIMRICPGSIVRVPILPLEFSPTKGADFRDWIRSGATISDFEKLIEKTPSWTEAKEQAEAPKQKAEQQAAPMQSESVNICEHDSQAGQQLQDGSGNGAFSELERKAVDSGIQYGDWEEDAGFEEGQAGGKAAPSESAAKELFAKFGFAPSISNSELRASDVRNTYLIDRFLVAKQPGIIAGPSKSLKTTISIDLAVCLATGVEFLGHAVPSPKRVLILSAESGLPTLKSTERAISEHRGVYDSIPLDAIHWGAWVPFATDAEHLFLLKHEIERTKADVVLLDPVYMALDGSTMASVSDNGRQLQALARVAIEAGATPLFVDHVRKGSNNAREFSPLELEDITGAGKAEFARQWILVNRRRPFEPESPHSLWLTYGGSAGHAGLLGLTVSLDLVGDDERAYSITWESGQDARQSMRQNREEQKERSRKQTIDRNAQKILDALIGHPEGLPKTRLADGAGLNTKEAMQAIGSLLRSGKLESIETTIAGRIREIYSVKS